MPLSWVDTDVPWDPLDEDGEDSFEDTVRLFLLQFTVQLSDFFPVGNA